MRAVATGALAVMLAVVGTGAPARAKANMVAIDWVSAIVSVVGAALAGGGTGSSQLDAAVRQIITAVEQSEQNILDHMDALASAEVRACARTHAIELSDIEHMNNSVRMIWAQNATACATLATSYLATVQSKSSADTIGVAIGEIYAIAIAARARAGLTSGIETLVRDQIRSYETLIAKLAPSCHEDRYNEYDERGWLVLTEIHYTCAAYNGDSATDYEAYIRARLVKGPLNRAAVDAEATRRTSRQIAFDGLPVLRTLGV
ncbi:hypothetical protein Abr02nite_53070 [Paractinoplanes brasiliensis]|nr:hypothetical protein Abr02nite_53070 [Actinoplanes brasiliensis]